MKQTTVIRGGGNIFADLGLPDADEHMLKARLVIYIDKMIGQAGLTQQAAAKRIGISQPDVSNLLRGRFEGFSLERLLGFVRSLGMEKKDVLASWWPDAGRSPVGCSRQVRRSG
jgi:predicted XRE-type DNA-binding protein